TREKHSAASPPARASKRSRSLRTPSPKRSQGYACSNCSSARLGRRNDPPARGEGRAPKDAAKRDAPNGRETDWGVRRFEDGGEGGGRGIGGLCMCCAL